MTEGYTEHREYKEGWNAFPNVGKLLTDNPYTKGTGQHTAWLNGYLDSREYHMPEEL